MDERILVIEDDTQLGIQIVDHLRKAGFRPIWWTEGKPFSSDSPLDFSLLILDLMLPGTYGMDILSQLRSFSDVPVLILSARNDTFDKVRALKIGADDYMTKPFWPEELVERVRARLRRPVMQREGALEAGALRIDFHAHEVRINNEPLELTRVEFDLLAALARRPGAAVTRQWLANHVLDPSRDGSERTLDVHMSRLRKKLGDQNPIATVWGIGYRFDLPRES